MTLILINLAGSVCTIAVMVLLCWLMDMEEVSL